MNRYTKSKRYAGVYFEELQNNDKSYYITYKDENNKKKWLKIGKHSEGIRENYCNQKRNEYVTKIRLGEAVMHKAAKRTQVTLDDLAHYYFENKIMKDKTKTLSKYRRIQAHLGTLTIDKITNDVLEKFRKAMEAENLSVAYIHNFIVLINAIFNFNIRKEQIKESDKHFKKENLERRKIDNERERFLDKEEIDKLYKAIDDYMLHSEELRLFVELSLSTGARLESILAIHRRDINFTHRVITIKDLKTDSTYRGFIKTELADKIKKYNNDKLFQTPKRTLQKHLQNILDHLFNEGLEKKDSKNRVVVHTLRHTFASHLAIQGTPIYTIQKLMNHRDINSTLRYAKLAPESGLSEIDRLFRN